MLFCQLFTAFLLGVKGRKMSLLNIHVPPTIEAIMEHEGVKLFIYFAMYEEVVCVAVHYMFAHERQKVLVE